MNVDKTVTKKGRKAIGDEAAAWVVKLNAGKLSREDAFAFEDWLNESGAHRQAFRQLSEVWRVAGDALEIPAAEAEEPMSIRGVLSAWRRLNPAKAWAGMGVALASCFALVWAISLTGVFAIGPRVEHQTLASIVGEKKTVELSDGSIVQLNTNTKVEVVYTPEERGIRLIRGEAHFDVAKNPRRPFRVYAGQGVIEAVGTAFLVQLKDEETEVTVTEGQVKLGRLKPEAQQEDGPAETENEETVAMVKAGRNAVLGEDQVVVEEIPETEIEKRLSWQRGVLLFDGDTLESAVREFERYTKSDIVIADENIRNTRIVGYFSAGDTDRFLQALESSFDVVAEHGQGGAIYLRRKEEPIAQ
ncbi:MAG: FecR domain-containing protein [Parvularculaceae bacterium]